MFNNKNNNLQIKNNEYEEEYEFVEVNAATGDQYRKFGKIRSKNGQITSEMVSKFHDESTKEAREWKRNNPETRSITFRDLQDEDGKQVIKLLPTGDLIFPSEHRVAVYDEDGNQIVGEENIRREIEKRETEWEQWEKEGKLQVVDYRSHDFDDGSLATVYFRIPPVKRHKNETDVIAKQFEQVGKRLKIVGEGSKESGEDNKLVGTSQVKGKIVEVNDDNNMDIDQSETSTSKDRNNTLLTSEKLEKLSKDKLLSLRKRIDKELENREKNEEVSSDFQEISTQELKEQSQKLAKNINSFSNPTDNSPKSDILPVIGIIGVVASLVGGLVFWKKSK